MEGNYYTFPDSNIAYKRIIEYFKFLVNEYEYKIISKVVKKYYTEVVYKNSKYIIEISNATNYTDYGFSIFVKDIQTSETKHIINIPYEKEDDDCNFIKKSSEYVHENFENIIKFLPVDILNKIENCFKKKTDKNYVKNKLLTLFTENINVGAEQLMRCILIIADGRKDLVTKIFKENFFNDPRDVIMEAMAIDSTINYGNNKFRE